MPVFNPISWVSEKIDSALNKSADQSSTPGLDLHTREALEILRVDEGVSDADIATVINLSPDIAEPFIKHARRILLKEKLTRPASTPDLDATATTGPDATTTKALEPVAKDAIVVPSEEWINANGNNNNGQTSVAIPQIVIRMEEHRRTARSFVEDKEDWVDRAIRRAVKGLMYLGPVALAFLVAMLIGEQYAKLSNDFWWTPAMYGVALVTEGSLWGTSFGASREFKRMLSDRKRIGTFVTLVFGFALFSLMSILAQWFVYESHFTGTLDFPTTVGIVFRTCSTTAVDTMALLVLGVLDYRSFETHLKRQKLEAQHIQELSQTEIATARMTQEEVVRQQNAEIENQRQLKRNQFFAEQEAEQLKNLSRGNREDRRRW